MSASEGPAFVQSPMGQAVMQQRTTHGEQQPAPVLSSEVPSAPHPMVPYVSSMPIASAPAVMGAAVSAMPPVCMPSVMPAPTPVVVAVEVTQGHPAGMVPAGIVGDRRAARRANGAPLTAEEALAQARAEGLTLHTATNTKTGYKGVSRGGKSAKKPYQAVRGTNSLGYYATAEEAALAYARYIEEERQHEESSCGEGVLFLKPKRERRQTGKITRWTEQEEQQLKALVDELGATGRWAEIASRLATERTPAGVDQHWQIMCGRRKRQRQRQPEPPPPPQHDAASAHALAVGGMERLAGGPGLMEAEALAHCASSAPILVGPGHPCASGAMSPAAAYAPPPYGRAAASCYEGARYDYPHAPPPRPLAPPDGFPHMAGAGAAEAGHVAPPSSLVPPGDEDAVQLAMFATMDAAGPPPERRELE
eukprot:Transcript_18861.p2 GENE.Transcript_18861~~Transcript_18861.p2  ORF type:complete len:422 (+),score=101.74 Transcript_18861:50-1315(+)